MVLTNSSKNDVGVPHVGPTLGANVGNLVRSSRFEPSRRGPGTAVGENIAYSSNRAAGQQPCRRTASNAVMHALHCKLYNSITVPHELQANETRLIRIRRQKKNKSGGFNYKRGKGTDITKCTCLARHTANALRTLASKL